MSYLDRLKKSQKVADDYPNKPKEFKNPNCLVLLGTSPGCFEKSQTMTGQDSLARWWLIHYPDREPVEVVSYPPATHAEILERHIDAVAAEPINLATPEPARACSSCTHATGRSGCGDPVAAGLAGVIRYGTDQGATCPALLATISPDLERRILALAERWNYSGEDLALTLAGARADPAGWRKVVEADEQGGNHAN
jgi:hypothetical protein